MDFEEIFPAEGAEVIRRVVAAGIGVLVSLTSDRGAMSVTVYVGDDKYQSYVSNRAEAEALWTALGELAAQKRGGRL